MFTIGVASIYLVNVSMPMNKNLKSPGALERTPTMSIPHTAKEQERLMGLRGFACFVVCFWKNWHSLHLVMISIKPVESVPECFFKWSVMMSAP
jgi:hypothetical protein